MSVSPWVYRFRGYLVLPPLILTLICDHWEIEADFITWPLGTFLVLLGTGLRIWAQQHLHYRLKYHKILTVTGPYSFVRNPIYIGNILIYLGATVISELLWFVPITFFYYLGLYSLAVRYEEAHLLEKYGEPYRSYMVKIPRWFPKAMRFENMRQMNEYLGESIVIELPCLFILLPYIIKEILDK